MKRKVILFSTLLLASGVSMGQAKKMLLAEDVTKGAELNTSVLKPNLNVGSIEKAGGDTVWENEFEDATEWVAAGPGNAYETNGWSIGATVANSWRYSSGGDMGTSGEFARFANNDPTQGNQVNAGPFTLTYTGSIDLTGVPVPHLEFEQYGALFADSQVVQISLTGGASWVTVATNNDLEMLTASGGSEYDKPMTRRFNLEPYLSGDVSSVMIRLYWNGGMNGQSMSYITYGWFVDNMRIVEGFENDVKINDIFSSVGAAGLKYTKIPVTQVDGTTKVSFGAEMQNVGSQDIDALLNVSNAAGYNQDGPASSVVSLAFDSLFVDQPIGYTIPATVGVYDFTYQLMNANPVTGVVTGLDNTSLVGGTGYADAADVAVTGGTGTGLTVDVVTDGSGVVTAVTVNNAGSGYVSGDVITISTGNGDATIEVSTVEDITLNNTADDVKVHPFEVTNKVMAVDSYDGTAASFNGGFTGWSNEALDPGIGTDYEIFVDAELERVQVGVSAVNDEAEYIDNILFVQLFKFVPGTGYEFVAISMEHEMKAGEFGGLVDVQFEEPVSLQAGDIILPVACFFTGSVVPIAFSGYTTAGNVVGVGDNSMISLASDGNLVQAPVVRLDFGTYLSVEDNVIESSNVSLYPNPASNNATIAYSLNEGSDVAVEIRDMAGKLVYSAEVSNVAAGSHTMAISTSAMAEGMYTYTLVANGSKVTKKFVVKK